MKKWCVLVAVLLLVTFMDSSFVHAEKVCLKVSAERRTGKVSTQKKIAAKCPKGFTTLVDLNTLQIPAKNVRLSPSGAVARARAEGTGATIGRLQSSNLKDALEDELAADLEKKLVAHDWMVESLFYAYSWDLGTGVSTAYDRSELNDVRVRFDSEGVFKVLSGCAPFIALKVCADATTASPRLNFLTGSYNVFGNQSIRVSATIREGDGQLVQSAFLSVLEVGIDSILLVNYNGSSVGTEAALLTRVAE
jgi:hypothetical protein